MSQWSEEGSTEVYVSCLRCQKTIKGAESYSLWAHVESKRCYPENAIKGWKQQAKEKDQQAKIDEAYRATAEEAARKRSKGRGQTPVPPIYPARPPPPKPTEVIELTGNERLEEITTFETKKKPKEERTRRVEVRDEHDRNKEKPKKGSPTAPPLDDEAGVGDVGERSNPIRLKSRSRTPSRSPSRAAPPQAGGFGPAVLKAATEAAKSARSAVLNLRQGRDPAPKDRKKEKPPIEERLNLPEFSKEGEEPRISPMRIVPPQVERPEGSDESDQEDRRRRRFRYEDPSSESELNAIDHGKGLESVEAVWATVDSGAATSCLPVEMCRKMGLSILKTTDLPYTTASGRPVHVHGVCTPSVTLGTADSSISGTGEFKAMDVAKPLLSVAKLVAKGWSVNFNPKGASMSRDGIHLPIESRGGVYKIPLDVAAVESQVGFPGHRAG